MAVNISRTARDADSRSVTPSGAAPMTGSFVIGFGISDSPTRCLPDFRHGGGDRALGNVLHDFYFSDFLGKYKVYGSGFGFLVGLHQLQCFCGRDVDFGKRSPSPRGVDNAVIDGAFA